MVILNTGGTFNKRYNPIAGELYVPQDNNAVESIVQTFAASVAVRGIIYKDSLEMDENDRELLVRMIEQSDSREIIVIHGTDTMDRSADAVAAAGLDKTVVFTGAMVPFAIDPIEATANLSMAIGYAQNAAAGVYIVMQGVCGKHHTIQKNKVLGRFERGVNGL